MSDELNNPPNPPVNGKRDEFINIRVLLIDDSEEYFKIIRTQLASFKNLIVYHAVTWENAKIFLSSQETIPDVILLDINLEKEGAGIQIFKEILDVRDWAKIPVIFITANTEIEIVLSAVAEGAVQYLVKPVEKELLAKSIKDTFKASQEKLRSAQSKFMRNEVLHLLTHELINPITSAQTLLQMGKDTPAQLPGFLPVIDETLNDALKLVDLSRRILTMDEQLGESDFHNLKQMFTLAKENFAEILAAKEITYNENIPEDLEVWINIDSIVAEVINPLINNAIKFSQPKSSIEVNAVIADRMVVIHFRDHGIGIPERMLKTIFSFSQSKARKGTKGEAKGSGFSLPLAKNSLSKIDGRVEIFSFDAKNAKTPDQVGTEVQVFLWGRKKS